MDITALKSKTNMYVHNRNDENATFFDGVINSDIVSKLEKTDLVIYFVYKQLKLKFL